MRTPAVGGLKMSKSDRVLECGGDGGVHDLNGHHRITADRVPSYVSSQLAVYPWLSRSFSVFEVGRELSARLRAFINED